MVIIDMIGQIDDSRMMIDALMSRSGEGCQFMMDVLGIFQGTKRSLKKWQMPGCPINLFSVGMLTLIGWNQGRITINQCGRHSFPSSGVQKD